MTLWGEAAVHTIADVHHLLSLRAQPVEVLDFLVREQSAPPRVDLNFLGQSGTGPAAIPRESVRLQPSSFRARLEEPMSRSQDDVETLRVLLNLPHDVLLEDSEPAPVPTGIKSFLRRATRQ